MVKFYSLAKEHCMFLKLMSTKVKGSDSHDLSTFLSLYNGKLWTRATGKLLTFYCINYVTDANFQMERTALTVGAKCGKRPYRATSKHCKSAFRSFCAFLQGSMLESLKMIDEKFCFYIGMN